MDVQPPKVISIAKKEELLHIDPQGKTLKLARNHPSLQLLQYIRDESHRFSQHYHHLLRKKKTFK
jgi:excinuclease ABC subunit C